jgi:SAM-dependent methyltransferase
MADQGRTGQQHGFYADRYSPARQSLREAVFREVYDDYIGQSSWLSTADYDRAIAWLDVGPESCVLDIACGNGGPGLRVARLTGCSVVGIDNHAQAVANAVALAEQMELSARAAFECHDAGRPLPFHDGAFDAVACFEALAHFRNRAAVFAEWARLLTSGGRLFFTDQVITGLISNEEFEQRTLSGYVVFGPAGYNERVAKEAGFEMLRTEDVTARFQETARRHCVARAARAAELREAEGQEEFERQNRYRAVAELLARERRLSHIMYLARKA